MGKMRVCLHAHVLDMSDGWEELKSAMAEKSSFHKTTQEIIANYNIHEDTSLSIGQSQDV